MDGILADRVVIVIGAGPGTGRALAVAAARQGATVVVSARSEEKLTALAADVADEVPEGRCVPIPADASDDESVRALREQVAERFDAVHGLVFAAFANPSMKPLARTDHEQIRAGMDLSVLGALRCVQEFTGLLEAGRGSVVLMASAVIHHSRERYAGYKVAKQAMVAIGQSLATELGPRGIRVNSVAPGYIYGDILRMYFDSLAEKYESSPEEVYDFTAEKLDLRRLPTEQQVADPVVFLLSEMAGAVTGQTLTVDCGEFHN